MCITLGVCPRWFSVTCRVYECFALFLIAYSFCGGACVFMCAYITNRYVYCRGTEKQIAASQAWLRSPGSFCLTPVLMLRPSGPESAFLQLFHCRPILPAAQTLPVNLLSSFCPHFLLPPPRQSSEDSAKTKTRSLWLLGPFKGIPMLKRLEIYGCQMYCCTCEQCFYTLWSLLAAGPPQGSASLKCSLAICFCLKLDKVACWFYAGGKNNISL